MGIVNILWVLCSILGCVVLFKFLGGVLEVIESFIDYISILVSTFIGKGCAADVVVTRKESSEVLNAIE